MNEKTVNPEGFAASIQQRFAQYAAKSDRQLEAEVDSLRVCANNLRVSPKTQKLRTRINENLSICTKILAARKRLAT
jgi:hypothetical protein